LNAPKVTADRRMSALILKAAQYPLHSGAMAVVRTLGRLPLRFVCGAGFTGP
jgi:hypothetical protein